MFCTSTPGSGCASELGPVRGPWCHRCVGGSGVVAAGPGTPTLRLLRARPSALRHAQHLLPASVPSSQALPLTVISLFWGEGGSLQICFFTGSGSEAPSGGTYEAHHGCSGQCGVGGSSRSTGGPGAQPGGPVLDVTLDLFLRLEPFSRMKSGEEVAGRETSGEGRGPGVGSLAGLEITKPTPGSGWPPGRCPLPSG